MNLKTRLRYRKPKWYQHFLLLSIVSGFLLGFSFSPHLSFFFIFFAFVPLLFAIENTRRTYEIFLTTAITFSIWFLFYLRSAFSLKIELSTTLILILVFIFYACLSSIVFFLHAFIRKKINNSFSLLLLFPLFWILYEFFIYWSGAMLSPVMIKDAFNEVPFFFKLTRYTGNSILTLYALLSNILLFLILIWEQKRRIFLTAFITLHVIFISINLYIPDNYPSENKITVATVQPDFNPYDIIDEDIMSDRISKLWMITAQVKSSAVKPDLIVWPESVIQGVFIDIDSLENNIVIEYIKNVASEIKAPVLAGALLYEVFPDENSSSTSQPFNDGTGRHYNIYNTAILVSPDSNEKVQVHYKNILLPFIEKVPFSERVAVFDWFKISIGDQYPSYGTLENKNLLHYDKLKIATIICSESTSPEYARKMISKGANMIVVLSNEGWSGRAPVNAQLNSYLYGIAVQNEKAIVKSSNNGPSISIDQNGELIHSLKYGEANILFSEIALSESQNSYTKNGEQGIIPSIILLLLLTLLFTYLENRSNKNS